MPKKPFFMIILISIFLCVIGLFFSMNSESQSNAGISYEADSEDGQVIRVKIKLNNVPDNCHVYYQVHVCNNGWRNHSQWSDGQWTDINNECKGVEAIAIKLSGCDSLKIKGSAKLAGFNGWQPADSKPSCKRDPLNPHDHFDWTGWSCIGTTGETRPLEDLRLELVQ